MFSPFYFPIQNPTAITFQILWTLFFDSDSFGLSFRQHPIQELVFRCLWSTTVCILLLPPKCSPPTACALLLFGLHAVTKNRCITTWLYSIWPGDWEMVCSVGVFDALSTAIRLFLVVIEEIIN
ncbi:unnamed protein product [Lactuca saligna]|uniref:Uncharacterized protein n=1 Tax=Lactuca saligna TaxID=75948 RepID=A0AA35Y9J0_LACSI|nr:unnamed protein product [Lactuca saligna]